MAYGRFAAYYDRLMDEMPYGDWVRTAVSKWGNTKGPSMALDLGCGTGSVSIPLAQMGWNVTGIDLSEDMIAVARRKAEHAAGAIRAAGGSAVFLQGDMRTWVYGPKAEMAFSFCDCLNYLLEVEDLRKAFQRTYEHLTDNGLFVFDMLHPNIFVRNVLEQPFVMNEPDTAYVWTCEWDEERMQIEHHLAMFFQDEDDPEGRHFRVDEVHVQRAYRPELVAALLQEAGFKRVEMSADFTAEPIEGGTERMFFTAGKGG